MSKTQELLDSIDRKVDQARIKHQVEPKDNFTSGKSEEAFGFANVAAGDLIFASKKTGLWNNLHVYDDDELAAIDRELDTWL